MVCEKCWAEFQRRQLWGEAVTYTEIVARNNGTCTPADVCGDRHDTILGKDGVERCRCGAVERPSATPASAPNA